ncbi:MAG: fumarylacetoacetate hydrolase family protein [Planctomycetota bacterium]
MRIFRFGPVGQERVGLLDAKGQRRDASAVVAELDRDAFANGALSRLADVDPAKLPMVPDDARWGAPVARPGKIVCIGLNYSDHAAEAGMAVPEEPIVFFKASNTVVGPYDSLLIPRGSEKTDWEVELGVVIGKTARYLESEEQALACIAGYTISHDASERAFQLERGGQWVKGKSCDSFNPLGPWLVTPDEIDDVQDLDMTLDVNSQPMQRGNTKTMIFGVNYLVHYLSQFMTLEPGDVISTGTPPGVGMGMDPPQYLSVGDIVELSIQGLGAQKQTCQGA